MNLTKGLNSVPDEEDEGGDDPGDDDHGDDLSAGAPRPVLGRHLDRAEAVDGDEDDGELGDEADGVVDREPEVAQYRSQLCRPVADQYVSEMEIGKLCWWWWWL